MDTPELSHMPPKGAVDGGHRWRLIEFAVDRSHLKQGRFTPGNHLPILPPEALLERRHAYVLLLTWNFAAEILAQQGEFRRRGGKFIVPLPEVAVV
jgi:hypothetical protein